MVDEAGLFPFIIQRLTGDVADSTVHASIRLIYCATAIFCSYLKRIAYLASIMSDMS